MEEQQRLKESTGSNNEDFVLSKTSLDIVEQDKGVSEKTQQLLDEYERVRCESEHLKKANTKLKEQNQAIINDVKVLSHYDSKESLRTRKNQQSLSMADLMQFDSVQKLNSKLGEKNKYLEEQLLIMRDQMLCLAE